MEGLLGCNEQGGGAEDGVTNVRVKFAPITGGRDFAGGGNTIFDEGELAEIFFFFDHPGRARGDFALSQSGFEGIECALEVTSLLAEDDQARAWMNGHHRGTKKRTRASRVVEENVEGIVGRDVVALDANVGGESFRRA